MVERLKMTYYIKDIALSAQRALIAMITPNIRVISIGLEQNTIKLLFIFDSEISEDDKENMYLISNKIIADYNDLEIEIQSITVPTNEPLPRVSDIYSRCVFFRKEDFSLN